MRGICFIEPMFLLTIHGYKTVTRRKNNIYKIGEVLYLKETYFINANGTVDYKFDHTVERKWENKLFMPSRYARYFIEIVDVRTENLQDITEDECLREGINKFPIITFGNCDCNYVYLNGIDEFGYRDAINSFAALFDEINGNGSWNSNSVVTRYEFKLIQK